MTTSVQAAPSGSATFFDVDETLVDTKSMFSFLEYYLSHRGEPEGTYERVTGELRTAAASGVPRTEINRRYYRLYAGEDARSVALVGEEWFADELEKGLFIPETVAELVFRRGQGDFVVLVSGSFFACLDPIASYVGADWAFGTRPVIRGGVLTGDVVTPMIGPAKGRVARATALVRGLDLATSSAYGDHISDLDLLNTVGRPVVVGDDPELVAHAADRGWGKLTPTRTPRHTARRTQTLKEGV